MTEDDPQAVLFFICIGLLSFRSEATSGEFEGERSLNE